MSNLIIGILACGKYAHKSAAVRRTWLRDCRKLGVKAYFLIGRRGLPPEIAGDTLYLDCGDDYLDLPRKTTAFLEYVNKNIGFDYVFKCDDDTYVNMKTLLELPYADYDYFGLSVDGNIFPREYHYKHVEPHQRQPHKGESRGPFMFGGAGYFLSKNAVTCALNKYKDYIDVEIFEDKLIGDMITLAGLKSGSTDLMRSGQFKDVFLKNWNRMNAVRFATFHPCSPQEMTWIHKRGNILAYFLLLLKSKIMDLLLSYKNRMGKI